jgi:hypothetical protein
MLAASRRLAPLTSSLDLSPEGIPSTGSRYYCEDWLRITSVFRIFLNLELLARYLCLTPSSGVRVAPLTGILDAILNHREVRDPWPPPLKQSS